jgi:hypothetical protein
MKTEIIVPGKIQAVQPKPTKAQLIEALVEQARKEHADLRVINEGKIEELLVLLKKEALEVISKLNSDEMELDELPWGLDGEVSLFIKVTSKKIKEIKKQISKLRIGRFYPDEVKKTIKEKLTPSNPLLNNPDVNETLSQLLAKIMGTKTIEV